MAQHKLGIFEKWFINFSLTQKWLFMLMAGIFLLIIKVVCTGLFFNAAAFNNSEELLTGIHNYNLWADIIFYLLFIAVLYLGVWAEKKRVQSVKQGLLQAIKEESLAAYAESPAKDELGNFALMVCNESEKVQQNLKMQRKIALSLSENIEPLLTCMEIVNDSIGDESEQVELLATAMNEMTATVKEVANNASSASMSTAEASEVAKEGSQFVDATISTINSLSNNIGASANAVNSVEVEVEGIGSVVDTIRSISEQTNLLALNAAIEAARAGEAGRGFAVVADEVRNLAKRTQDSTVEIQGMIEQLQSSAEDAVSLMGKSVREADIGVEQVTQAGTQLAGIVEKVQHISDMNYQIASAADEQTTVAGDINQNLDQVKEVVEGSVTVLREVTEMAEAMNQEIQELTKITNS